MKGRDGAARPRGRYLLAVVLALALSLGAVAPVLAAEQAPGAASNDPRIVGGDPVPDGKYEFVAALLDATRQGSDYQKQFCGGTLIDRDSVLTAAHCLEGTLPAQVDVVVGRQVLDSDQGQKRSVVAIERHPRYTTSEVSFDYDAAVLQLGSPVTGIAPIKLTPTTRNAFEEPGRRLTIAGWGNTEKQSPDGNEPDSFPNRMQEAEVPVDSDSTAKSVYGDGYTKPIMVAAGREGKDSCQGDSGGPLFERTGDGPFQVGIVSFGAGCGSQGFPGVYAEVNSDQIRPFITNAAAQ